MSPGMAERDGKKLDLSPGEASVLYTLANAAGDIVASQAIGAGYGSIDETPDSVRVLIARVRRKLGAICPIETIRYHGYRWNDPALVVERNDPTKKLLPC